MLVDHPKHEYWKHYQYDYDNNMVGGEYVSFVNVPIKQIKESCAESIKNGEVS